MGKVKLYYSPVARDGELKGFYVEDVHGEKACNDIIIKGGIKVTEELHEYLLTLGIPKIVGVPQPNIEYGILDKDSFTSMPFTPTPPPIEPSDQDRLAALEAALMGVL